MKPTRLILTAAEQEALGAAVDAWNNEADPNDREGLQAPLASAWAKLATISGMEG